VRAQLEVSIRGLENDWPVIDPVPVAAIAPPFAFVWMSVSSPGQKHLKERVIESVEDIAAGY